MLQLIIDWLCVAEPHLDNDITITDAARHSIPFFFFFFFFGGGEAESTVERDGAGQYNSIRLRFVL